MKLEGFGAACSASRKRPVSALASGSDAMNDDEHVQDYEELIER